MKRTSKQPPIKSGEGDLSFLKHPDNWPCWPVCPLKRSVAGATWPELATLCATQDGGLVLVHDNMYAQWTKETKQEVNITAEKTIADGWRVDQ